MSAAASRCRSTSASARDVWVTNNNWQYHPAALDKVDEALSILGGGQGVVFFGMAKPVRSPQIGPAHVP